MVEALRWLDTILTIDILNLKAEMIYIPKYFLLLKNWWRIYLYTVVKYTPLCEHLKFLNSIYFGITQFFFTRLSKNYLFKLPFWSYCYQRLVHCIAFIGLNVWLKKLFIKNKNKRHCKITNIAPLKILNILLYY